MPTRPLPRKSPSTAPSTLPTAADVARVAPDRSRARGPGRRLRRWYRRSTSRQVALTMIVLGCTFLVLALTLVLVMTAR